MTKKYIFLNLIFVLTMCFNTSCKKEKTIYNGYIEADYVYISPYSNGKIDSIFISKGDKVKKGTSLFKLDGMKENANLKTYNQLEQGVNSYIENMKKGARPEKLRFWTNVAEAVKFISEGTGIGDRMYTTLEKDNAVSYKDQQQITHIHKAALKMSQALIAWVNYQQLPERPNKTATVESIKKALKAQISHTQWEIKQVTQTAPDDACVFDIFYRKGEFVQAGKPVVSLLPPGNIKAIFFVDGKIVNNLKLGDKVLVKLSNVTNPIFAIVNYISPKPEYTDPFIYSLKNNKKYMYLIEAKFNPTDSVKLHPGQPIEVDINNQLTVNN
jgi:HlyD family secretion protein